MLSLHYDTWSNIHSDRTVENIKPGFTLQLYYWICPKCTANPHLRNATTNTVIILLKLHIVWFQKDKFHIINNVVTAWLNNSMSKPCTWNLCATYLFKMFSIIMVSSNQLLALGPLLYYTQGLTWLHGSKMFHNIAVLPVRHNRYQAGTFAQCHYLY